MAPNNLRHRYNSIEYMPHTGRDTPSPTNPLSVDRLYEIARQLAEMELTGNAYVDKCVSLLDTNFDVNRMYSELDNCPQDKNYCEVVSVPSSTHVAQIVGKQGSKIKLLRAKSRTYIQTPVTGEEPVFIITGRREDVLKVKTEILSASEHFTFVSEERKLKFKRNSDIPGSVSLNLLIPSSLIGLIVGRNGNTIRNIQKLTETYIETPKMVDNSSSFRITGLGSNVETAKQCIIDHVMSKTNHNFSIEILFNGDHKLIALN
ncbi:RNA-binding protein MEX3B-like [Oppia nitens]|uniref:RNA-binding protein MEX3B-like n=1 Tax=Oppia nitens TaxID=1686743 RepID=UPI0023DCDFED|nr:RNA-binding protein MEX3B-like [Oppia nitens]